MAENNAVLTREFVPEDLRDRAYLKDYLDKPWDKTVSADLFKKLDGAETLIGKRPQLPDPKTAKDDELDKLFSPYRPEKADDYEVKLAEEQAKRASPEFIKALREAMFEGKLTKAQASKFLAKFGEYGLSESKKAAEVATKKALEFDTLAKAMLGEQSKPIMERVKKTLAELAPAAAKGNLDKITDENLVVMAAVIDAIQKKYVPEDELNGKGKGNSGGGAGGGTKAEKLAEAQKLQASKEYSDPFHADYDKTVAKVNQLFKEIAAL